MIRAQNLRMDRLEVTLEDLGKELICLKKRVTTVEKTEVAVHACRL